MIRIIGKLPRSITVACSGGVDSMTVVDFLIKGRFPFWVCFFWEYCMYIFKEIYIFEGLVYFL